jgi:hypothetical protein
MEKPASSIIVAVASLLEGKKMNQREDPTMLTRRTFLGSAGGVAASALIPHGHHVLAAAHCVASQPESLCPMIEYGVTFTKARQAFQTRVLFPEAGRLEMPAEPGLGPGIDWSRIERV